MSRDSKRVVGLETEYGILAAPGGELTPEAAARLLFRHRPPGYRNENLFLINGGRLYLDIGAHPEYATAECSTVAEVVAHDLAGEEILRAMARRADQTLAARGSDAKIHLLKNNVDSAGNTFGCHENYSVSRDLFESPQLGGLFAFLVTRQILVGAGAVVSAPRGHASEEFAARADDFGIGQGGSRFVLSARAAHMVHATSADPTGERALINTRDEPLADSSRFRRLQLICGDTNICDLTSALKVGLTMLVLDLIDAKVGIEDLAVAHPIQTLHRVSADPMATFELASGRSCTAPQLQSWFLERIVTHLDRVGSSPALGQLQERLLDLAGRGIAAVESEDYSRVDTELDWAIKRRLFLQVMARRDVGLEDVAIARTELAYHDLSDGQGLAQRLRGGGLMARAVSEERVQHLRNNWPTSTRAAIRGEFVQACVRRGVDFAVSWDRVRLDSPPRPQVDLPDPFALSNADVKGLIGEINNLSDDEATWIDAPGKGGLGAPG